jgi:hypothetical protein
VYFTAIGSSEMRVRTCDVVVSAHNVYVNGVYRFHEPEVYFVVRGISMIEESPQPNGPRNEKHRRGRSVKENGECDLKVIIILYCAHQVVVNTSEDLL